MQAERQYDADDLTRWGLMAIIYAPLLVIVLVPLYQVLIWLRSGDWMPMDIAAVGCHISGGWYCEPTSWYGLHSLLQYMHVSIGAAVVVGAGILLIDHIKS